MLIKILNSSDKEYYFKVVANNGETIAVSETYTTKEKCVQTARTLHLVELEIGDFCTKQKPGPKKGKLKEAVVNELYERVE